MTNKLRMPKKEVPKKTAVSKLAKDKEVRIVKHFLPVTYSRESYNYELPEVDNGEDDEEYSRTCFKKYSDLNRLVFPEKKSKYTRNVFSKTENNAKTSVLARKKNKRGILSRTEPSYRSKSCIECSRNLVLEEPDSVFIKKPSNNSLRREKPKETSSKINNQNILVSSSSPNFNDGYITNLKREIAQNRGKGSDVCLDTKLYLMHKNEIHNEKVRLLREEISKLVNMDLSERKNRVSEIKTEINQFRRNDYFAVYNVETQLGDTDGDSDKEREDDESDKSSTTCIKKPVKPNMNDSTESEFSPTPSQSEFDEDREKEVKSSDLSEVEQETRKPAEPACLHICLMGDEKNPGPCCGNMKINTDEENFIKAKIFEANMLIDRVKDTLCDIKNKSKRNVDTLDHEENNYLNNIPHADSVNQCQATNESARPKTRRPFFCRNQDNFEDKFKTSLCEKFFEEDVEVRDSYEILQAKLNTIIEQGETDSQSGSEQKESEEEQGKVAVNPGTLVSPATSATPNTSGTAVTPVTPDNTPSPVAASVTAVSIVATVTAKVSTGQQSDGPQYTVAQIQVKPEVVSVGVQNTDQPVTACATQTETQRKKFCVQSNCVVEIPPVRKNLCKANNLNVQHLPPIDIKRKLVLQNVLKFYIDNQGKTHFQPQSKGKNMRYIELTHPSFTLSPPNFKLRFEKERKEAKRSGSSELSFILDRKVKSLPKKVLSGFALHTCVSDGELIMLRKKQLQESLKPKPKEDMDMPSKEIILKSFHIYDNPNVHDPGVTNMPLKVSSIDTFVYKTYINPNGLPANSTVNRKANMITPETLQRISQHTPFSTRNKSSSADTKKMPFNSNQRRKQSVSVNTTSKKSWRILEPTTPKMSLADPTGTASPTPTVTKSSSTPPLKLPSKNLYDIGLYAEKSTQVETQPPQVTTKNKSEKLKAEAKNLPPRKMSESSFEKISLTVSYSTEETESSDYTHNNSLNHNKKNSKEDSQEQLITVKRLDSEQLKESQGTFLLLKEKFAKEGYTEEMSEVEHLCEKASTQSVSIGSLVPQFIVGLTESNTHDLKKILPHIRKNVTGSIASKQKSSRGEINVERKDSSNRYDDSFHKHKHKKHKLKRHKKDYTVLSMQVHGDCIRNNRTVIDSHLKLGKNGRYKDEEDLFCDDYAKVSSIPMKRRMLKNTPKPPYVNKFTLDSSSCEAIPAEPTLSEGEIKCRSTASLGEVRKRAHSDNLDKIKQKMTEGSLANVIRERRNYFNHWITYYINKNANTKVLSRSSSTSTT